MKKDTLQRLLFLRGNWRILEDLCQEHHAATLQAAENIGKRRREQASGQAAVAQARHEAELSD